MQFKAFVLGAVLAAFSGFAVAASCPKDMKQIDAKLATNPMLSEAQMSEVKQLRKEGEDLHKAGKHKESVEKLHRAKAILGI